MVEVTQAEALARQISYEVSEAGHHPDNELYQCALLAIHRVNTAAIADLTRERDELAGALRIAEDALRDHACHAEDAPCRRSKIECLAECGLKAGNALMAIASALAKLDAGKVQP